MRGETDKNLYYFQNGDAHVVSIFIFDKYRGFLKDFFGCFVAAVFLAFVFPNDGSKIFVKYLLIDAAIFERIKYAVRI